jgi:hypothetical protein
MFKIFIFLFNLFKKMNILDKTSNFKIFRVSNQAEIENGLN